MRKQILLVLLVLLMIISLGGCEFGKSQPAPEPDIQSIKSICQLATLRCDYNNVAKMEKDKENFFVGKSKLWVEYRGYVEMGIDVNKVDLSVGSRNPDGSITVKVVLPEAEVLTPPVVYPDSYNAESFTYSAEGFIKKVPASDEIVPVIQDAQDKMLEEASSNGALLYKARQRAADLIQNYIEKLGEAAGVDYNVVFE